jgi:hypothetical protein
LPPTRAAEYLVPTFERYIGIDYSGAATCDSSLPGLRVYVGQGRAEPREITPPPSPRKYWTRRGLAEWLATQLAEPHATLVGIDHGLSFPLPYFEAYALSGNWQAFLDDFCAHWPTDQLGVRVDCIRKGNVGNGGARMGNARWRRLCETRSRRAKSVFHFDVQGSVAKSTHAGLPFVRYLRRELREVHVWPFDGWTIAPGRSAIAEVYPALWSADFARDGRSSDQHDAYVVAAALARADHDGTLSTLLRPKLTRAERAQASVEGWILGLS